MDNNHDRGSPGIQMDVEDDYSSQSNQLPDGPIFAFPAFREAEPRKRGRKPKRPQFRNKKTEDLDKFWFRKFRSYIRKIPSHTTEAPFNREFWEWFRQTEPGANACEYKSYNLAYKRYVVNKAEFRERFARWLSTDGRRKMYNKFE
jgi:hypothetical protein